MFSSRAALLLTCFLSLPAQAQPERGQPQPVGALATLSAKDTPLTKVLAEIKEKTGINVESQFGELEPKIRIELTGQPFWKALDQLADKADATVIILPRDGRILLAKRNPEQRRPLVSTSGPFRFCVKRMSTSLDLDTGALLYSAAVEVAWEPGLRPLFLETIPQDVVAIDDKGGRHLVPNAGKGNAPVDGRTSLLIEVPLPSVPRTTSGLTKVEGRLEAIAPSKMVRFVFPKIDAGASLAQERVTCKITKAALGKDRWTVQLALENPSGGTILESYQPWDSNNVLVLESKDGKSRIVANSYVRESQSSRRAVLSYHFTDREKLAKMKPEEWSLVYQTPALVVTVPLTFSFANVPLP